MIVTKSMKFPLIVVFGGNGIIRSRKKEFKTLRGTFKIPNKFRMKNAGQATEQTTAIVDYEGKLYTVTPINTNNSWLSGIAKIVDFVTIDCVISEGIEVTVGELLEMAKAWKNNHARMFRKFLVSQDPEAIFDSTMFRKAWEHSYIRLPEQEWGEDAFL